MFSYCIIFILAQFSYCLHDSSLFESIDDEYSSILFDQISSSQADTIDSALSISHNSEQPDLTAFHPTQYDSPSISNMPVETSILTKSELPTPIPASSSIPTKSDMPTPFATQSNLQTKSDTPTPSYSPTLEATIIPPETPIPTESPEPEIDESEKIYVCEGVSCNNCGKVDEDDHETLIISFPLLDELLSINNQIELEITICGSSHSNNPKIKMSHIENKRVEFKGKKEQQYITLINDTIIFNNELDSIIDIESEKVTLIVDESKEKQNFYVDWAELKKSPIEVENLTLHEADSDLYSLSSVKNTLFGISSRIIDDSISKILIGNDFVTFNPQNRYDQNPNKKSNDDSSTATLHAINDGLPMDIWVSLEQKRLDFTAFTNLNEIKGIKSIVIDLKNDDDEKAIIAFDSTWNSFSDLELLLIKHECKLEIISDNNDFAKKINVIGNGVVIRNGKIDGEAAKKSKKFDYFAIIVICLVVVLVILIACALFIILRKKCNKRSGPIQNYNEYLNNSEELDPISMPV